jgi:hypothetical protein
MTAMWCFQCGLDYAATVAECIECGVPTVDYAASLVTEPAEDAELIAYELHGWNGLARVTVERALHAEGTPHRWEGPTLAVTVDDEDKVDGILATIDERMNTSMIPVVEADEEGRIGFDLGVSNADLRARVEQKLDDLGIAHDLQEDGFLMVPVAQGDEVGDIIEDAQSFLRSAETFGEGVDGIEAHEVVEALFFASDVLRRTPGDAKWQRQILDNEALARQLLLPFGYEATMWRGVLDQTAILVALIEDTVDDELIETEASALRQMLHPYV